MLSLSTVNFPAPRSLQPTSYGRNSCFCSLRPYISPLRAFSSIIFTAAALASLPCSRIFPRSALSSACFLRPQLLLLSFSAVYFPASRSLQPAFYGRNSCFSSLRPYSSPLRALSSLLFTAATLAPLPFSRKFPRSTLSPACFLRPQLLLLSLSAVNFLAPHSLQHASYGRNSCFSSLQPYISPLRTLFISLFTAATLAFLLCGCSFLPLRT